MMSDLQLYSLYKTWRLASQPLYTGCSIVIFLNSRFEGDMDFSLERTRLFVYGHIDDPWHWFKDGDVKVQRALFSKIFLNISNS